jgi:glutathione S-transferase
MEISGLPYQLNTKRDVRKAPNKKFPVLHDNGTAIPDSSKIQEHLETAHGIDFNKGLSDQDRAISHALIRMVEEHTYFAVMRDRWLDDQVWGVLKDIYFKAIPSLMRGFIAGMVRKDVRRTLQGQGMGRFTEDDMLKRVGADLEAVRLQLGDKQFLFGDGPTAADASVGPMLHALGNSPVGTRLSKMMQEDTALQAYISRVTEAIYPDPAKLSARMDSPGRTD